ncbi:hypothetical protein FZX02_00905, partial [Synechococcus sp. MU1644]|nr:hypothetical protein [Synechococcus sp. MU1644]
MPGTNLVPSGNIKLIRSRSDWLICFHFPNLYIREDVLLADWLALANGETSDWYTGSRVLNGDQAAVFSRKFLRHGFQILRGAEVSFLPLSALGPWHSEHRDILEAPSARTNAFVISSDSNGLTLGRQGGRFHSGLVILSWSDARAVADQTEMGAFTYVLPLDRPAFQEGETVGTLTIQGRRVSASLLGGVYLSGGLFYSTQAGSSVLDVAVRLRGMVSFKHTFKHPWPDLPIGHTLYRLRQSSDGIEHVSFRGGPGGGDGSGKDKAFITRGGHVELVVSRGPDRTFLEARSRRIHAFDYHARMHNAFVPLAAADMARFDTNEVEVRVVIDALHAPLPKTTGAILALAPEPSFSLNLNSRSKLYVHRAADLVDLKLGFRNLYLKATPHGGVIDRHVQPVPGGGLDEGDRPTLFVHLPPQHVAERVFLRPLEDAKAEEDMQLASANIKSQAIYQVALANSQIGSFAKLAGAGKGDFETEAGKNLGKAKEERNPTIKDGSPLPTDIERVLAPLVEARASGPTRIVLEEHLSSEDAPSRFPMVFSAAELLDFSGFRTRVSKRALERGASIERQLEISGITPGTPTASRVDQNGKRIKGKVNVIGDQLDGKDEGRIADDETQIEYPYDLHLSPASSARWLTSLPPDAARRKRGMGLFSIRIDPTAGADSVRALWSRSFERNRSNFFDDFDPVNRGLPKHNIDDPASFLPGIEALPEATDPPRFCGIKIGKGKTPSFRISNDGRDRMEFVLQTSIFGLPALLPEPLAVSADGTPAPLSSTASSERHTTPPSVVPVPAGFKAEEDPLLGKEGVFVPQPFREFDVAFSAMGATGRVLGEWSPPAGFFRLKEGAKAPEFPALTVERWSHQTYLSRDIEAEVVYKAFLFPFGHRASVVKTTERLMLSDPCHPSNSAAYLIQKFFVVINNPLKTLPAMGMPYRGRGIPCSGVRMITEKVEINPPDGSNGGSVETASAKLRDRLNVIGASVFHPVTVKQTERVQFEYVLQYEDGTESDVITSPLIVVDNTGAHDPLAMSHLIAAYNDPAANEEEVIFPRANLGMQRIRYAPQLKRGDTEFRTEHWNLGAHPREITGPEFSGDDLSSLLAPYTMDAAMEGAEQPPFYPALRNAAAEIQSINTMNGRSSGLTRVGVDANYLMHGFEPGTNDSQIFLSIVGRADIDTSHRKNASGGLAAPNNRVISISRVRGPVGGSVKNVPTVDDTLPKTGVEEEQRALVAQRAVLDKLKLDANSTEVLGPAEEAIIQNMRLRAVPAPAGRLSAAHQNKFDPLEYFGKALSDAKLFGLIPLKDVVKAIGFIDGAPELLESASLSFLDFQAGTKEEVQRLIGGLRKIIADVLREAEEAVGELPGDTTAEQLYPDVFRSISTLDGSLVRLNAAVSAYDAVNSPDTVPVVDASLQV